MKPITTTKVATTFKMQPNGCKDTPDSDKHETVNITFDYSALNPDKVKVPDDILRYAVNSWAIKFQQIRNSVKVRDFEGLKKAIDSFNGTFEIKPVGVKMSEAERESRALDKATVRFTDEYPGISPEDMGLYLLKKVTLDELRKRYPKGDIVDNINKAKGK